jgi:putative heme iron utilization protein
MIDPGLCQPLSPTYMGLDSLFHLKPKTYKTHRKGFGPKLNFDQDIAKAHLSANYV